MYHQINILEDKHQNRLGKTRRSNYQGSEGYGL